MTLPKATTAKAIVSNALHVSTSYDDGTWGPARSEPFDRGPVLNLLTRFTLAWEVFLGKADAVYYR